jgi:hypothetical protein
MTAEYPQGDEPLIPMPALSLPALRQAVAAVVPSRLPEFLQEIQDAFTQADDEDSVFPSATSTSAGAPPSPSSGGTRSPPGSTPPNEPSPTPTPLSGTRQSGEVAEIVQAAYRVGSLAPGAAQAAQERCARRAPGAGSARTPPDASATAARAQRIRSIAVSGYSP